MPRPLPSVTEGKFVRALESIFRRKYPADTALDYLRQLDLSLPFSVDSIRVVYETFPVYGNLINLRPRNSLMQYTTETPDDPIMVLDDQRPAKDGLFFAQWLGDTDLISRWLNRMATKSVYVNSYGPESVIVVPVSAFLPC